VVVENAPGVGVESLSVVVVSYDLIGGTVFVA